MSKKKETGMFDKKSHHKSEKSERAEKQEQAEKEQKAQAEEAAEKSKKLAKQAETVESDIRATVEKLKDLRDQEPNAKEYKQAISHLTDALTILGRLKS